MQVYMVVLYYPVLRLLAELTLPCGTKLHRLYCGSGHLHQVKLEGQVISDMEIAMPLKLMDSYGEIVWQATLQKGEF